MNDLLVVPEELKKNLKSKVKSNCSLVDFAIVKIYICYEGEENFNYTNLEGYLCLMVDRQYSCLFLQLYDYTHNEKHFELELYTNFEKGYSVLHDYFHSIEFPNFTIGFNFSNKTSAQKFKNSIFYNSILLNLRIEQMRLPSTKKAASDNQKDPEILKFVREEWHKEEKNKFIINFCKDEDVSHVTYDVNVDEYNSSISPMQIFLNNLEIHKRKIESLYDDENREISIKKNQIQNISDKTNFIKYDIKKRKSVYQHGNNFFSYNPKSSQFFSNEKKTDNKKTSSSKVKIFKIEYKQL